MPEVSVGHLIICLQALETAMKHYEFISTSQTVDAEDFKEIIFEYERTLIELCKTYKAEEAKGNVRVPLKDIVSPDYLDL